MQQRKKMMAKEIQSKAAMFAELKEHIGNVCPLVEERDLRFLLEAIQSKIEDDYAELESFSAWVGDDCEKSYDEDHMHRVVLRVASSVAIQLTACGNEDVLELVREGCGPEFGVPDGSIKY